MEKNIEVSLLFDFYGELLKPSGKKAIDLYYNEDLSLAEVADETGITRQGERAGCFRRGRERSGDGEEDFWKGFCIYPEYYRIFQNRWKISVERKSKKIY